MQEVSCLALLHVYYNMYTIHVSTNHLESLYLYIYIYTVSIGTYIVNLYIYILFWPVGPHQCSTHTRVCMYVLEQSIQWACLLGTSYILGWLIAAALLYIAV